MKIMKKIAAVTIAAAALFAFAGCAGESEDENGMLSVKGSGCSIDYTNESDGFSRGFKSLKTNHLDAVCKITQTVNSVAITKDNNGDGVLGFIFDLSQDNTTKLYNFTIAGTRYNVSKDETQVYVTKYINIDSKYLSAGSDFCGSDGKPAKKVTLFNREDTAAQYIDYLVGSGGYEKLEGVKIDKTKAQASIWIDVIANDGTSKNRKGVAGSYTVKFYTSDPKRETSAAGSDTTYDKKDTAPTAAREVTISASDTGYNKATQNDLGFYANVYSKRTLTGSWELSDIEGSAEPIVYAE